MEPPYPRYPPPGPSDPPPRTSRAVRWALLALIATFGLLGVFVAAQLDRLDTALLFVGIPCAIAVAVALLPTGDDSWATLFQVTSILLLLAAALLHEGALCVLLAAPLVYGSVAVVHVLWQAAEQERNRHLAVVPLLVVVALEGVVPGMRVNADQHSDARRIVAAECSEFEAALARGPRIDPDEDRGLLLGLAQYPTPTAATGTGLSPGDTWSLAMPAGRIATEVSATTDSRIDFDVTDDTARTTRWVDLHTGSLQWTDTDRGCEAEVRIDYTRKLDPSFWFGPVTDVFMDAGADAFLAGLD